MRLETREHERARRFRDHALAAMRQSGTGPSPVEAEALVKLGLLLAAEVPPEEADVVLEGLAPYGPLLADDTKGALCEMLVMRGRPADAEALWDSMEPIPRMQAQLRCLAHRLLEAAERYGEDEEQLAAVTEAMLAEPVNALAALVEQEGGTEEEAVVAYLGTRLLARTRSVVEANAPVMARIWDQVAGEARDEEEERAADEAAEVIAADMLAYEGAGPGGERSGVPMLDWVHKVAARGTLPGRGTPQQPRDYLGRIRRLLFGRAA